MSRSQVRDLREAPSLQPAANPVDSFFRVRPDNAETGGGNALTKLAAGLSEIEPKVAQVAQKAQQRQQKFDTTQGQIKASQTKAELGLKEAVKKGVISEGQSPAFRKAFRLQQLRERARQQSTQLRKEYAQDPKLSNSTDPNAINGFLEKRQQEFFEELKKEGFSDAEIAEAAIPQLNSANQQLRNSHVQGAVQRIEEGARTGLRNETVAIADQAFGSDYEDVQDVARENGIPLSGNKAEDRNRVFAASMEGKLDGLVKAGMSGRDANQIVAKTVAAYAQQTRNIDVLDALDKISTGNGSLGNTAVARQAADKARDRIISQNREDADFKHKVRERQRDAAKRNQLQQANSFFMENMVGKSEQEKLAFMESFDALEYAQQRGITDPDTVDEIRGMAKSITDSTTNVTTDAQAVTDLHRRIATNPDDPSLISDIYAGAGESYSAEQAMQLADDARQAQETKDHPFLNTKSTSDLLEGLESAVRGNPMSFGGNDAQNAFNAKERVRQDARDWVQENPDANRRDFHKWLRSRVNEEIDFVKKVSAEQSGPVVQGQEARQEQQAREIANAPQVTLPAEQELDRQDNNGFLGGIFESVFGGDDQTAQAAQTGADSAQTNPQEDESQADSEGSTADAQGSESNFNLKSVTDPSNLEGVDPDTLAATIRGMTDEEVEALPDDVKNKAAEILNQ